MIMININDLKSKEEVIEYLQKYVKDNLDLSRRKAESEDSFGNAEWSQYQAYQLGSIKTLNKILTFLTGGK